MLCSTHQTLFQSIARSPIAILEFSCKEVSLAKMTKVRIGSLILGQIWLYILYFSRTQLYY